MWAIQKANNRLLIRCKTRKLVFWHARNCRYVTATPWMRWHAIACVRIFFAEKIKSKRFAFSTVTEFQFLATLNKSSSKQAIASRPMTITQLHTHTLFGWYYYYYYYVAISNTRWLHNNYQDESHYSQMVHHHFTAEEPKKTCEKRENIWKQRGTRRDVQKPTKWKSRNEIPTNTLRFTQTHISASTTCHSAGHCRCRFEWNANWVSARRMSDECLVKFVCTVCVGRTHRQSVYKQMKTVAKKK